MGILDIVSGIAQSTSNIVQSTYRGAIELPGQVMRAVPGIQELPKKVLDTSTSAVGAVSSLVQGDFSGAGDKAAAMGRSALDMGKTIVALPSAPLTVLLEGEDRAKKRVEDMNAAMDKGVDFVGDALGDGAKKAYNAAQDAGLIVHIDATKMVDEQGNPVKCDE